MRLVSGWCETAGFSVERRVLKWHVFSKKFIDRYGPLHKELPKSQNLFQRNICFLLTFWNRRNFTSESPLYISLYKPKKHTNLPVWSTTLQPFLSPNCISDLPFPNLASCGAKSDRTTSNAPGSKDLTQVRIFIYLTWPDRPRGWNHRQESDGKFDELTWQFQTILAYI